MKDLREKEAVNWIIAKDFISRLFRMRIISG
jgi:hypothetical protein